MRGFTDETAPHQLVLEAYGVALRVCASTPHVFAQIEPYLPPGWRILDDAAAHRMGIVAEDDGSFTVYDETASITTKADLPRALVALDSRMRMHVAVHAPGLTFIHAAVAAHRGRAIVIPGHSYFGKTTLVAALVRAGATYYSDEFAVLDDDGLVHPYPKRLSVRRAENHLQVEHHVDELQGTAGVQPIPLGQVVFTRYVQDASWNPKPLTAGAASVAMVEHAVPARIRPEATMAAITRALRGAVALEGERGEASEVAKALLELSAQTG